MAVSISKNEGRGVRGQAQHGGRKSKRSALTFRDTGEPASLLVEGNQAILLQFTQSIVEFSEEMGGAFGYAFGLEQRLLQQLELSL